MVRMPVVRALHRLKYLNLWPQVLGAVQGCPSLSSWVAKAVSTAGQGRAFFARRKRTLDRLLRLPYVRLRGRTVLRRSVCTQWATLCAYESTGGSHHPLTGKLGIPASTDVRSSTTLGGAYGSCDPENSRQLPIGRRGRKNQIAGYSRCSCDCDSASRATCTSQGSQGCS